MRLKPTTIWVALTVLAIVAVVFLAKTRADGPIVSGRSMGYWMDVLDVGWAGGEAQYKEAFKALTETTNHAALQSQILSRIEARYSPTAKLWHQAYFSMPPKLRPLFPKPRFRTIEAQLVMLLDGIMPDPSARQRAALQMMLSDESLNNGETWTALSVALSTSTQTVPESVALLRQQLATENPTRRLNICEAIRNRNGFEGWAEHRVEVSGLLADLRRLSASETSPEGRFKARKALDRLTFELRASESSTAKNTETNPESALTKTVLFGRPGRPASQPLNVKALRAAEPDLPLASQTSPPAPVPFRP